MIDKFYYIFSTIKKLHKQRKKANDKIWKKVFITYIIEELTFIYIKALLKVEKKRPTTLEYRLEKWIVSSHKKTCKQLLILSFLVTENYDFSTLKKTDTDVRSKRLI